MSQLIDRKKIKPHPHNKMWGKPQSAVSSMKMVIAVTKDVEPIRVCKDLENWACEEDRGYLILSGHSRFEIGNEPLVECKVIECESEEEQVLRLIAYNAGHSTHPSKLTAAASYCHKHFPSIAISSIMDAAGIVDNRIEWEEALKLSVKAVEEASPKHRKRTSDSIAVSAANGPTAIKETAGRSLSQKGTKSAEARKSPPAEIAAKPSTGNNLTAEIEPPQGGDFLASDGVNEAQEAAKPAAEVEESKETENKSECTANTKAIKSAVGVLNRELNNLGRRSSEEAVYAVKLLVALAEDKPVPQHPSTAVIAKLQKQLAETKEMADDNGKAFNIAEGVVNKLLRQAVQAYLSQTRRDGYVTVDAMRLRDELVNEAKFDLMSMNPDDLQASLEAAMRQEN